MFLDIIKQVQLPAVQVSVRAIEEEEQLKNMTYREVTLHTHLPNFKRLSPNACNLVPGNQIASLGFSH